MNIVINIAEVHEKKYLVLADKCSFNENVKEINNSACFCFSAAHSFLFICIIIIIIINSKVGPKVTSGAEDVQP